MNPFGLHESEDGTDFLDLAKIPVPDELSSEEEGGEV